MGLLLVFRRVCDGWFVSCGVHMNARMKSFTAGLGPNVISSPVSGPNVMADQCVSIYIYIFLLINNTLEGS